MIDLREPLEARPARKSRVLRRLVPVSLAAVDAVLIYLAFVLAYWVRYSLKIGPQIHDQMGFAAYQPVAVLLLCLMMAMLFAKGAYRVQMSTEVFDEIGIIFSAATISIASIVVVTAMLQEWQYSRGVILYMWVLVILLVSAGRCLYRLIQGYCHRRGWGVSRVLVVGATDAGMMAMQSMRSRPDLGYHLIGFVYQNKADSLRDFGRFRALGTVADIPDLVGREAVDEVIISLPASEHEDVWPILRLCEDKGVGFKLIPDLFEMSLSRVRVDDIAGIPLLDVREQPLRRLERAMKRAIDILVAGFLLVATAPLMLVLIILIRLESHGPALLRQNRVGVNGRPFTCFKLRTMRADADELRPALQNLNETDGPIFKIRDDPRCTRVGRRMRRWSLDELPQIINVLKGEMSMVGPRPPLAHEVAQYEPSHMRRLEVKPGMTGIWQVSGRSELPFDEMVMMDTYYVDNWSPSLDLRILVRTVVAVLARHGAY